VESIIPYYEITSVVAVPLRAGGGTRGKILEAMALGRPVVSTSLGAEGLEVTHKENIMIADRPEDFATITVELMRNRSFRSVLIDNARKFVESKHSWRKIAGNLDQAYKEICAAR
jgi:glycosyltransferase involved in cell wall biosynthesis